MNMPSLLALLLLQEAPKPGPSSRLQLVQTELLQDAKLQQRVSTERFNPGLVGGLIKAQPQLRFVSIFEDHGIPERLATRTATESVGLIGQERVTFTLTGLAPSVTSQRVVSFQADGPRWMKNWSRFEDETLTLECELDVPFILSSHPAPLRMDPNLSLDSNWLLTSHASELRDSVHVIRREGLNIRHEELRIQLSLLQSPIPWNPRAKKFHGTLRAHLMPIRPQEAGWGELKHPIVIVFQEASNVELIPWELEIHRIGPEGAQSAEVIIPCHAPPSSMQASLGLHSEVRGFSVAASLSQLALFPAKRTIKGWGFEETEVIVTRMAQDDLPWLGEETGSLNYHASMGNVIRELPVEGDASSSRVFLRSAGTGEMQLEAQSRAGVVGHTQLMYRAPWVEILLSLGAGLLAALCLSMVGAKRTRAGLSWPRANALIGAGLFGLFYYVLATFGINHSADLLGVLPSRMEFVHSEVGTVCIGFAGGLLGMLKLKAKQTLWPGGPVAS